MLSFAMSQKLNIGYVLALQDIAGKMGKDSDGSIAA